MADVMDGVYQMPKSMLFSLALSQTSICAWQQKEMWICDDVCDVLHIVSQEIEHKQRNPMLPTFAGLLRCQNGYCGILHIAGSCDGCLLFTRKRSISPLLLCKRVVLKWGYSSLGFRVTTG